MKDAIIKRIEGYHHFRTVLWTVTVVLVGGTINKFSNIHSIMDVLFVVVGVLFINKFYKELIRINIDLENVYKKLEGLK
jgi:hypothetical protein